jgi:glycosyltransferase involved in cell wall biosynthesis
MVKDAVDKKVCMVTWGHDALDDRIFFKEAWSLRKVYGRVTILTVGHKGRRQVGGIRVVSVERHPFSLWTLWRLCLASRGERASIYHLHEPQLLPLGLFLKILYHAKIIYDIHEHLPEMIRDFSTKPRAVSVLLAFGFSLVERLLVRLSDAVLVASDLLVSRFARTSRRLVAIYNYPRADMFISDPSPPLSLRRKYQEEKILLCHGQIGRVRGIPMLIKAVKLAAQRIQGLKLILLGPLFGDSYRAELLGLIEDEDADALVEFWEPIPHQTVPQIIALSEVGLVILPSLSVFQQSLPIKLFEYMACGVPVVGSKLPAIERVIDRNRCGLLVNPMDVEDIARAITHLLEHPEEARSMGSRGRRAIEEKYNWSHMEVRLLDVYGQLEGKPC